MKKIKFTDTLKTELSAVLRQTFPNETKESLDLALSDFIFEAQENGWDFVDNDELKDNLTSFAKQHLLNSIEIPPDCENGLTVQESVFCGVFLKTLNKCEAYAASHKGCTFNPDSVRSLASRFIRRPKVAEYLNAALSNLKQSAIEYGVWSREQSLFERREKLDALNADIESRKQRLQTAIELIQNDKSLSNAEKAQRIIQATQRPIYGRDTIEAHKALCDSLDALTWTNDREKTYLFEISNDPFNSWENKTKRDAEFKEWKKQEAKRFPFLADLGLAE